MKANFALKILLLACLENKTGLMGPYWYKYNARGAKYIEMYIRHQYTIWDIQLLVLTSILALGMINHMSKWEFKILSRPLKTTQHGTNMEWYYNYGALNAILIHTPITKFMGQHGAHLGPVGPRWSPCWPHEPCYMVANNTDRLNVIWMLPSSPEYYPYGTKAL